jgi:hypothetical protein
MKWLKIIVTLRARSCFVGAVSSGMIRMKKSKPFRTLLIGARTKRIEVEGKEVDASEYYRFVRIGEDTDDNEVQGWGFDIHIERTATY